MYVVTFVLVQWDREKKTWCLFEFTMQMPACCNLWNCLEWLIFKYAMSAENIQGNVEAVPCLDTADRKTYGKKSQKIWEGSRLHILPTFFMNYTVTQVSPSLERPSCVVALSTGIRISSQMKETPVGRLLAKIIFWLA